MMWLDRAIALEKRLEAAGAPKDILLKASDATQHFIWAKDCRRQANNVRHGAAPGWGAKADKAHYHGKKCYFEAQKWLDERSETKK